jgi:eukaryotic-like serine/threonine-protein kinase
MSEIPAADWTWIDAAANRFEQEWKRGNLPRIEDYLAEVDESRRPLLLEELMRVEHELLPTLGIKVDRDDYLRRFPDSTVVIDAVFAPEPGLSFAASAHHAGPDPTTTGRITPGGYTNRDQELASGTHVRYFGDYELIREIGRGGMGIVYKARQISLNRPVALKMIRSAALATDEELRRFQNEAEAVALLDHPHIVPILEVGNHDGQRYFSMKLIGTSSLDKKLGDYTADPKSAARFLKQAAEAVHHAHQRGILHRDLKPANILIDERGEPYVTDFGLAKRVAGDSELTYSGAIMGTPAYMAPEQASGRRGAVTTSSDVYGLGAILYALLTGRAPFTGDSVDETLEQVRSASPSLPSKINPSTPRDLEVICLKCLEKEPSRRYASAQALGDDLDRYLAGEPILARPVRRYERVVKWARRRPTIAALMGLVTLVTALGLGGVLWQWRAALLARHHAERESERASAQSELAGERLQEAIEARAKERAQTELAEQRLYDARMNLVERYWDDYYGAVFQQGLDEQLPANQGGIDRRGFEWFYWQRKLSSGHITLKGHNDGVSSVAFSPDGKRLASAGTNGIVTVREAGTWREILSFKGHAQAVTSLAFSPDSKHLASASHDGTVKLWDAATGQEIRILKGHTKKVNSVSFSSDGERLASAGNDGTVKVWIVLAGKEILSLAGHTNIVNCASFSPDGKHLASAGTDGTLRLWDAATGQEVRTLERNINSIDIVAFSPDGKRLASASWPGLVKIRDATTGQETLALKGHTNNVLSLAFSPHGKWLASAGHDGTVKLWDAVTGEEIHTLKGHTHVVMSVAFSPDGQRLASASWDSTLKVWDAENGQEALTLKGNAKLPRCVAFSPDSQRLASANADGTVKIWDVATGEEPRTLNGHATAVDTVAFSPNGKRLASGSHDGAVKVWDAETGQETVTIRGHTKAARCVSFSPDGMRLASASGDGMVNVWDATNGQEIRTLWGHKEGVNSVSFSPNGERIVAGCYRAVKVWDAATGQEILTFKGHRGSVEAVAFSPDGQRVASAAWDTTVKVWDAASGQETLTLRGHGQEVRSLSFSPDGRRIVSAASGDTKVKVWDATTGLEVLTLKGHTHGVFSATFSPDSRRIASASHGAVKIWDARPLDDEFAIPGPARR